MPATHRRAMTTTATLTGRAMTTTATLTGITLEDGECTRCGRELGKVYEVTHADGTVATYGRRCCAAVTGYKANRLDAEARIALRTAIIAARRTAMAVEYGELVVNAPPCTPNEWHALEVLTNDRLWDDAQGTDRGWSRWEDWRHAMAEVAG